MASSFRIARHRRTDADHCARSRESSLEPAPDAGTATIRGDRPFSGAAQGRRCPPTPGAHGLLSPHLPLHGRLPEVYCYRFPLAAVTLGHCKFQSQTRTPRDRRGDPPHDQEERATPRSAVAGAGSRQSGSSSKNWSTSACKAMP